MSYIRDRFYEEMDVSKHPEHETRCTLVSEYLRKYGQGKIETMPTDSRPEINDSRSDDEKLDQVDKLTDSLGTEELDVLLQMQDKAADFEKAFKDIELTKKQKADYDKAIEVLKDENASYEMRMDAYRILDDLERKNKITRAR